MEKNSIQGEIIKLLKKNNRQLDINFVANELGVHWFTVYKAVADCILAKLQDSYPNVLYAMPIVPLKTSKSLLLTPKSMLAKGVDHE